MVDKRFEDSVKVEDLMKKPQKELSVMIYLQAVKTNGNVKINDIRITKLETKCDSFISTRSFTIGSVILGTLIVAFNILNYFVG